MLAFWLFLVALAITIIVWAIADPHDYFSGPKSLGGLVASVLILALSVVRVPRMVRAVRRR